MRRNNQKNNNGMKQSNSSEKLQSVTEKERAYAEARARIFGEEATSTTDGSSATVISETSSVTSTIVTSTTVVSSSNGGLYVTADKLIEDTHSTTQSCHINTNKAPVISNNIKTTSSTAEVTVYSTNDRTVDNINSNSTVNASNKKGVVDAAKWKEKKVIIRNKDAERNDPDFVRHNGGIGIVPGPAYQPSNHYDNGGMYGQQYPDMGYDQGYMSPQMMYHQQQMNNRGHYIGNAYPPQDMWSQQNDYAPRQYAQHEGNYRGPDYNQYPPTRDNRQGYGQYPSNSQSSFGNFDSQYYNRYPQQTPLPPAPPQQQSRQSRGPIVQSYNEDFPPLS
jgi:hypothetical protein